VNHVLAINTVALPAKQNVFTSLRSAITALPSSEKQKTIALSDLQPFVRRIYWVQVFRVHFWKGFEVRSR